VPVLEGANFTVGGDGRVDLRVICLVYRWFAYNNLTYDLHT
jgi:hypothetical protein